MVEWDAKMRGKQGTVWGRIGIKSRRGRSGRSNAKGEGWEEGSEEIPKRLNVTVYSGM